MPSLRETIESAYERSGNSLGWKFLYSPPQVLEGAKVAFIGLNPGGSKPVDRQGEFAMASGSAYRDENWAGHAPGESPLQRQVLALFERLNEQPEAVLAGNLVPFRSPDWVRLENRSFCLEFGQGLWRSVLERARPSVVVTMGTEVRDSVARILHVEELERFGVGWGRISAYRGRFGRGTIIALPHLSRFGVMTREKSAAPLSKLFSTMDHY